MKRMISIAIFAACAAALSPRAGAQDCSNWSNWDLRGTYTFSGSGWADLSKLVSGLPSGTIPMSWVSAKRLDGAGGGTGWVALNAGGVQLSIQLVNFTYSVKADCSVLETFSMKIKELNQTIGPVARLLVIAGTPGSLQLQGMFMGGGPGMPVDLLVAQRISMQ